MRLRVFLLVLFTALAVPSLEAKKLPNDCVIVAVEKQRSLAAAGRLQAVKVWARVLCVRFADRKLGHALCAFQPAKNICVYEAGGTRELRGVTSRNPLTIAREYYRWEPFLRVTSAHFYDE